MRYTVVTEQASHPPDPVNIVQQHTFYPPNPLQMPTYKK